MFELVRDDPDAHVCVFVNFWSEVHKVAAVLKDLLAVGKARTTGLSINGNMDKHEIFAFFPLFFLIQLPFALNTICYSEKSV